MEEALPLLAEKKEFHVGTSGDQLSSIHLEAGIRRAQSHFLPTSEDERIVEGVGDL